MSDHPGSRLACGLLVWCLAASVHAQHLEGGAHAAALGGAATALPGQAWGHANPATWATRPARTLSFFVSEAFGLDALRLGAVQAVQPFAWGTVGLGARTFGFEAYRETHAHLGLARGFALGTTRRFYAATTLTYQQVAIPRYGSAGALGVSVGWLVAIRSGLHLGAHATNLNAPRWAGREALPRTLALGLAYAPTPTALLVADVFKDVRFPASFRAGLEVVPLTPLALRVGVTTQPVRFTAGLGLRAGRLAADLAAERHAILGWSPAAALTLDW